MKIKIIDLLNKIANDEEVPKKIKYKDNVYYLGKNMVDLHTYQTEGSNTTRKLSLIIDNEYLNLNDEVEILEEPKKIAKINRNRYPGTDIDPLDDILDKLDELIDVVNELKRDK